MVFITLKEDDIILNNINVKIYIFAINLQIGKNLFDLYESEEVYEKKQKK